MTDVEIEDSHGIFTPRDEAFSLEGATGVGYPDLFTEGLGNRRFRCCHGVARGWHVT